jgi:MFS family permease
MTKPATAKPAAPPATMVITGTPATPATTATTAGGHATGTATVTGMLRGLPGYRHLLAARAVSSVIVWVDFTLIFSSLTYFWNATPTTVGMASALYGLPGLLLGPWFGRLADRKEALSVLLGSYAVRGSTSLLLLFAPDVHVFVLLVFLKGLGNLGAMPAEQIVLRSMLNRDQLVANAGVMTTLDQLTKIAAPLLGALTAALYSPIAGFGLSAALSVVGLALLIRLRRYCPPRTGTQPLRRPAARQSALWGLLRDDADFRLVFIASLIQTAVLALYDPLLALFLKGLGFPVSTFGTLVSCTAAGAILGAVLFRRLFSRFAARGLAFASLTGFGLTVLIPGLATMPGLPFAGLVGSTGLAGLAFTWPAMLGLWVANGCFYGLTAMSFVVAMQTRCPRDALGSVSATARSAQLALLVLGPLAGSAAARWIGLEAVFAASGLLALACGGVLLIGRGRVIARCAGRRDTGSSADRSGPAG